jgi:hypothetical protein
VESEHTDNVGVRQADYLLGLTAKDVELLFIPIQDLRQRANQHTDIAFSVFGLIYHAGLVGADLARYYISLVKHLTYARAAKGRHATYWIDAARHGFAFLAGACLATIYHLAG